MIAIDKGIITDLPIGRLDNHLFRRAMQFLVLADDNGTLPSITDLSWYLHVTENEIEEDIIKLISEGFLKIEHNYIDEIFHVTSSRKYHVKNHVKYHITDNVANNVTGNNTDNVTSHNSSLEQKEIERKKRDAERSKRYRERKKALHEESQNVTQQDTLSVTEPITLCENDADIYINNINNNNNNNNNNSKENLLEFSNENSSVNSVNVTSRDESDEPSFSWAKEEEHRAYIFWKNSGIYPTKTEFGRWIKELRQFTEANISESAMIQAIQEMRRDKLHIGAPGSIFKVARSLTTQNAVEAPLSYEEIAQFDEMEF